MEYGCIGEKLSHSFSKIIHASWRTIITSFAKYRAAELDSFMKKADFKAINVTIPYKQAVIPYLYYISDTSKKNRRGKHRSQ